MKLGQEEKTLGQPTVTRAQQDKTRRRLAEALDR
jgi:hypothetical protein